jgi:RNA-directed DNA polymerase
MLTAQTKRMKSTDQIKQRYVVRPISPLLANIFLHYVLDEWFEQEVRPRLKGQAFLVRYADDFVIGVAREDDARRILEVLPMRMSKYG